MSTLIWGLVRSRTAPVHAQQAGSWSSLCELLTTHEVTASKDGAGWLPAAIEPGPRNKERAGPWCVMVLDIEAKTENILPGSPEMGKRLMGPLPPSFKDMCVELELQGWSCCAATSFSHEGAAQSGTLGPRYRLVFEVSRPVEPEEIEPLGLHLSMLLGLSECTDEGCLEASRLFYWPRCPQERQALAEQAVIKGSALDVDALLMQARIANAVPAPRKAQASGSVIEAFNAQADIGKLLTDHGYAPRGVGRWMWPGSSTGKAGVVQLPKSQRIYTHHPNDPLRCKVHSHDAFGAWCLLAHGGDLRAAVRNAARLLGMDRIINRDSEPVPHPPEVPKPGFEFVAASELVKAPRPTRFLLDELIEAQSLALLFAAPGAGKSFTALAWAACVATGLPWLEREVERGAVFYLAGEGHAGLSRRLRAWELETLNSLNQAPLFVSKAPATLMDRASALAVTQAITELSAQHGLPALIVIDTFARNMGNGDENSNADVGIFVNHIDQMRAQLGCCVLLVHHSGHLEAQRARGGSSLPAAMDSIFRIDAKSSGFKLVHVKSKESELSKPLMLALKGVPLPGWRDSKGREMNSAVVVLSDQASGHAAAVEKPLTERQQEAWQAYLRAAQAHGRLSQSGEFDGIHRDLWRNEFYANCAAESAEAKRKAFNRAMRDLVSLGHLSVKNDVFGLLDGIGWSYAGTIVRAIENREIERDTDIGETFAGQSHASHAPEAGRTRDNPLEGLSGCPADATQSAP